jgi:L-galactose dehydrogenase
MPHGPHPHLGTSWECRVKHLWSEAATSKLVRMQTRPLGRTGLDVAPVSLGTASIGEMFGRATVDDAVNVVHRAIERGVNVIDTSVHYGSAEERLGVALADRRDRVILATKAGRFGSDGFDFSPQRLRASLEQSLRRMRTDHVDIFQLHSIEWVPLGPVFDDGLATLQQLKDEGKTRFIGMTGYPLKTMEQVVRQPGIDVILTYAHGTLLDNSLAERIVPMADRHGVGVMNAAAVSLGLLTPGGSNIRIEHPATPAIRDSAERMRVLADERGIDLAFLANQYSIWRSGAATTVVGTAKLKNLEAAIRAAEVPPDPDIEREFVALRPDPGEQQWSSGLPANN